MIIQFIESFFQIIAIMLFVIIWLFSTGICCMATIFYVTDKPMMISEFNEGIDKVKSLWTSFRNR